MTTEIQRHAKELADWATVESAWKERLDRAEDQFSAAEISASQFAVVYQGWARVRDEKARAEGRLACAHERHGRS